MCKDHKWKFTREVDAHAKSNRCNDATQPATFNPLESGFLALLAHGPAVSREKKPRALFSGARMEGIISHLLHYGSEQSWAGRGSPEIIEWLFLGNVV